MRPLREEVRRELHAVHKAIRTTFILVTHDQVEAMSLSDRVVVMSHGRVEQIGTPQELYGAPKTDFVAQFVGAANLLKGEVATVADQTCTVKVAGLEIAAGRHDGLAPGAECTVAIHPESVRLAPEGDVASGPNCFRGTVRHAYFLGRTQEVLIDVEGTELRVVEVRGNIFRTGEAVQATIPQPRRHLALIWPGCASDQRETCSKPPEVFRNPGASGREQPRTFLSGKPLRRADSAVTIPAARRVQTLNGGACDVHRQQDRQVRG